MKNWRKNYNKPSVRTNKNRRERCREPWNKKKRTSCIKSYSKKSSPRTNSRRKRSRGIERGREPWNTLNRGRYKCRAPGTSWKRNRSTCRNKRNLRKERPLLLAEFKIPSSLEDRRKPSKSTRIPSINCHRNKTSFLSKSLKYPNRNLWSTTSLRKNTSTKRNQRSIRKRRESGKGRDRNRSTRMRVKDPRSLRKESHPRMKTYWRTITCDYHLT